MFNMNFKKAAIFLTVFSMFCLVSCGGESSTSGDASTTNSSSSVATSNGTCPLDGMVDEYQNLADKLKKAMSSSDLNTILSINQDIADWLKKWESASSDSANNCSLQDATSATKRMQAIALSLME